MVTILPSSLARDHNIISLHALRYGERERHVGLNKLFSQKLSESGLDGFIDDKTGVLQKKICTKFEKFTESLTVRRRPSKAPSSIIKTHIN